MRYELCCLNEHRLITSYRWPCSFCSNMRRRINGTTIYRANPQNIKQNESQQIFEWTNYTIRAEIIQFCVWEMNFQVVDLDDKMIDSSIHFKLIH